MWSPAHRLGPLINYTGGGPRESALRVEVLEGDVLENMLHFSSILLTCFAVFIRYFNANICKFPFMVE